MQKNESIMSKISGDMMV